VIGESVPVCPRVRVTRSGMSNPLKSARRAHRKYFSDMTIDDVRLNVVRFGITELKRHSDRQIDNLPLKTARNTVKTIRCVR
jgi:hypothetical protein